MNLQKGRILESFVLLGPAPLHFLTVDGRFLS
jgi:hypothetical protein